MTADGAHRPLLAAHMSSSTVEKSTCWDVVFFLNELTINKVSNVNSVDKQVQKQSEELTYTSWTLQIICLNIHHQRINEIRRFVFI
jgi:hypothetical protein